MRSRQQQRSQLQEKRIADDVEGRVQAGSGSSWRAKSDVRKKGELRIEAKYTDKESYILKLSDLLKIQKEAIQGGLETPVLQIEFARFGRKYAVMDYKLACEITGATPNTHPYAKGGRTVRLPQVILEQWHTMVLSRGDELGIIVHIVFATSHEYALLDWGTFLSLEIP